MEGLNKNDSQRFIDFLFEPDDIFEVRIKQEGSNFATSLYITPENRGQFLTTHLSIHHGHQRHVWVGVGPRERVGSTNPAVNRALWCDFDDSVTTEEVALESIRKATLPEPSMLVHSGNGYHAYWKLHTPLEPTEARKYSKGVHRALPTDATHDPTRVMRLPGTVNFKGGEEKPCSIVFLDESRVYSVLEFPKIEMEVTDTAVVERQAKMLSEEDVVRFSVPYVEGSRHHLGLAIAGFLRKDRFFSRSEATEALRTIHTRAGYEWPDDGIIKTVNDTYNLPMSRVAGRSALYEFGIVPPEEKVFQLKLPEVKRPTISIIDFTEDIKEQEFWVDGLVGPGLTTLWAAPPKAGKSFCVMQLGYNISKGKDIWGWEVPEAKKVLYFQGELSKGMVYARAMSMFGRANLPPASQYAMTDKPEETITLNETPEVLLDLAQHFDVIIIDPLSAFNGNDENSYTSVRETLGIFDSLKAQGKAVILVHHTRKLDTLKDGSTPMPTAADARGSGLWVSAADSIVMQQKLGNGNVRLGFTLRAAPDRDDLNLYRLPSGLFTHDRGEYLAKVGNAGLRYELE